MIRKLSLLLICILSLSACQKNLDLRTITANREGNAFLEKQSGAAAMEKYIEALRHDPFVSGLHLNLGLSLETLQQAEKALQAYKEAETLALKEGAPELVFMARFNQGQLLGKAQKVDEALAAYQAALDVIPNSMETKTNIELLIQSQQGGGKGKNDKKDDKGDQNQDQKDQDEDGEDKKEDEPKEGQKKQSPKYQPRPYQGEQLNEADVKKILDELKQQEEKIRAEYNKKETKEQPRDKDW
ncbi:hypothetical protein BDW_10130 [Bdellovibrio bacteriovorus W]|nr:hypothetical protein BDW_10130 [Bdellovibrio bacteriovorus W]